MMTHDDDRHERDEACLDDSGRDVLAPAQAWHSMVMKQGY
jgi:hypothetical protein